jgi:AIR synthase-related protein
MTRESLEALAAFLASDEAFRAKLDIARVAERIDPAPRAVARWEERVDRVLLGDDTAAVPDGGGFLLLAAEGMLPEFLDRDPYFAGWSSVMVNVNDVASMGGYPLAAVDVYFHAPASASDAVLSGIRDACAAYGVPLVGGHTTRKDAGPHVLAVAILGRAEVLLTSFGARAGDTVVFGVDVRGRYRKGFPFWNATEGRTAASLRGDLAALGTVASQGAVHACKDVSNAGIAGTLLMMLEASGVGATLDVDAIPRPEGVGLREWLTTFPSYGFLFATPPQGKPVLEATLRARGLTCESVGAVDASSQLKLASNGRSIPLWDLAQRPYTGFRRAEGR